MSMFLPEQGGASGPPGSTEFTPGSPQTTSDDVALMQRVLSAAAGNPNLIPDSFMAYIVDYIQIARLSIPIGQVFGYREAKQSVRVSNSANQAIPTAVFTTLGFDTDVYQLPDSSMHDKVTNNSRLTCVTPGRYVPTAYVAWAANGTGERSVRILKNGTPDIGSFVPPVTANQTQMLVTWPAYDLVAGDYLEIQGFQSSGGNLNALSTSSFALVRVS